MSRSGYTDDCDDTLAFGRWRAQVKSASRGNRGQKLFTDLAKAFDEMPVKELIVGKLKDDNGSFCTLGVLGAKRGLDLNNIDPHEPEQVGEAFDIAKQLAAEIVYENDEHWQPETPSERWQRMRAWIQSQIKSVRPDETTKKEGE